MVVERMIKWNSDQHTISEGSTSHLPGFHLEITIHSFHRISFGPRIFFGLLCACISLIWINSTQCYCTSCYMHLFVLMITLLGVKRKQKMLHSEGFIIVPFHYEAFHKQPNFSKDTSINIWRHIRCIILLVFS